MFEELFEGKTGLRYFINPAGMNAWAESQRHTKGGKKGRRRAMGYADFPDTFEEQVQKLLRGREGVGRKLQIGVMGSAADLKYGDVLARLAEQVGEYIARAGAVLIFVAKRDYDSLSTAACRGAKKAGGITVGLTEDIYGEGLHDVYEKDNADIIVVSYSSPNSTLVYSCDAIIYISDGEVRLRNVGDAPIVVLCGAGSSWDGQILSHYGDIEDGVRAESAPNAEEAVLKATELNCWKWMTGGLEH